MKVTAPLVSLLSAIVAAVVSHFTTQYVMQLARARADDEYRVLTAPTGSAILFALVFVVFWFIVNLIFVAPWFLRRH